MFRLRNTISFIIIFFIALSYSYSLESREIRKRIPFDDNWKFAFGHAKEPSKDFDYAYYHYYKAKADEGKFSTVSFNDDEWKKVTLPHDWAVTLPFSEKAYKTHGYKALGPDFPDKSIGWYRKKFIIPASDSGKRFQIRFDGVFRESRFWINGIYLGSNMSGYNGVGYDITDFIEFDKENVITVRVDATQIEGWFYEGAGIYRHVWLNVYDNLHLIPEDIFVYTETLSPPGTLSSSAKLSVNVKVNNEGLESKTFKLQYEVLDRNKKSVKKSDSAPFTVSSGEKLEIKEYISIENPILWDTEEPYLYILATKVISADEPMDEMKVRFGIRTFRYERDGFYLNDKKVQIKGLCVHQDHAGIGTAMVDEMQYYRIGLLQAMGANAYRTAHNPPTPELLDACDSLGMLVLDETRLLNSSNEYLRQFENFVKRDRNHACVFMWNLGNEEEAVQRTSIGKRIAETMILRLKELDPSRTCTYGGSLGNIKSGVNEVIPVRGFNYNLSALEDYENDHPDQPIIGTEVASTVCTRGVYLSGEELKKVGVFTGVFMADTTGSVLLDQDFSYPNWASTAEQWLSKTATDKRFMGAFVWTGFDYRGEPTPFGWPAINSHFGVMDMCGFPKNVYYYYKSWWSDEDILHIAPHWNLNLDRGETVDVWVYSNADKVELFLNGKSLGKKVMPKYGHLNWNVKYREGKLKAVGYRNGRKFMSMVETTGRPAKIILAPHKYTLASGKQDVVVVNVTVVDEKGLEVPYADNLIKFDLTGDARIIGVGNGNPNSHESDYVEEGSSACRSLFNGKCQVIIRSGDKDDKIGFSASSEGLAVATVELVQSHK
ncbi:MAG: beta-galactosidase GalA [Candidatus Cryptobacteroides sp.]